MAVFGPCVKGLSDNMQAEQLQLTLINGNVLRRWWDFFVCLSDLQWPVLIDRGLVLVLIPGASVRVFMTALAVPGR